MAHPAPLVLGDALLGLGWLGLLIATLRRALRSPDRAAFLFPTAWLVIYLIPISLIRNRQMYYMQDLLPGLAILLALSLDRVGPRWRRAWWVAWVVVAVNGLISNYTSSGLYHWQFTAQRTQRAYEAVRAASSGRPLRSVVFITQSKPFWQWALSDPLLPYLLGQDDLQVHIVDYRQLRSFLQRLPADTLYIPLGQRLCALSPRSTPPAPGPSRPPTGSHRARTGVQHSAGRPIGHIRTGRERLPGDHRRDGRKTPGHGLWRTYGVDGYRTLGLDPPTGRLHRISDRRPPGVQSYKFYRTAEDPGSLTPATEGGDRSPVFRGWVHHEDRFFEPRMPEHRGASLRERMTGRPWET